MHIVQREGARASRLLRFGRLQTDAGVTSVPQDTRVALVIWNLVYRSRPGSIGAIKTRVGPTWKCITLSSPFLWCSSLHSLDLSAYSCLLSSFNTSSSFAPTMSSKTQLQHRHLPRSVMWLHASIDRFAIPCMSDAEGITTMPVSSE